MDSGPDLPDRRQENRVIQVLTERGKNRKSFTGTANQPGSHNSNSTLNSSRCPANAALVMDIFKTV